MIVERTSVTHIVTLACSHTAVVSDFTFRKDGLPQSFWCATCRSSEPAAADEDDAA